MVQDALYVAHGETSRTLKNVRLKGAGVIMFVLTVSLSLPPDNLKNCYTYFLGVTVLAKSVTEKNAVSEPILKSLLHCYTSYT